MKSSHPTEYYTKPKRASGSQVDGWAESTVICRDAHHVAKIMRKTKAALSPNPARGSLWKGGGMVGRRAWVQSAPRVPQCVVSPLPGGRARACGHSRVCTVCPSVETKERKSRATYKFLLKTRAMVLGPESSVSLTDPPPGSSRAHPEPSCPELALLPAPSGHSWSQAIFGELRGTGP